jgi:hypothetical protein
MNEKILTKRLVKYLGIPLIVVLAIYLATGGVRGWGSDDVFAGIGLALVIGAMIYLKRLDDKADQEIAQRIKAEYPTEAQPQVFQEYKHLKTKELEYLFAKILDEAKGNFNEVKKFTALAESVGWKAFLENRW